MASKNADELFNKVKELLARVNIDVYNDDGSIKDLYTVVSEVYRVMKR